MDYISLIGIGVGLAMDAFAVCVANGAITKKLTVRFAVTLAVTFGAFQAIMPMLGWLVGKIGETFISSIGHWIALILLCYIGIQMIRESFSKKGSSNMEIMRDQINFKTVLTLAVATSIDALATGVILPSAVGASTILLMLISVMLIGVITFILCLIGVFIGKQFGTLLSGKAEITGGIVLILIGIKIFCDHTLG